MEDWIDLTRQRKHIRRSKYGKPFKAGKRWPRGKGWVHGGNISIYIGQYNSHDWRPTGKFIWGKYRSSGQRFKQPTNFVVSISGEKGSQYGGSGSYNLSWYKGFTQEPSSLFAITPAYDMAVVGKQYELTKDSISGTLDGIKLLAKSVEKLIDKSNKLPSREEVNSQILKDSKHTSYNWVVSNYVYALRKRR
jgi:hypothetical protein